MSTPTYNRLNKDDAVVLLVDHQTGLISSGARLLAQRVQEQRAGTGRPGQIFQPADHPHHQLSSKAPTALWCLS